MQNPTRETLFRKRIYQILERGAVNDRTDDVVHAILIGLILVNVGSVILQSVPAWETSYSFAFAVIEIVSVTIFSAEYGLRLWSAPEHTPWQEMHPWRARLHFALQPLSIIDLLAIIPFYAALMTSFDLRTLLLLRLIRFFKLARYSPGLATLFNAIYNERRGLIAASIILAGTVIIAASVMHVIERDAQPDKFGTIPDAIYWAVITLATVGYGDVVPVTGLGKMVASLTAVLGILMLALPVGLLASAFAREIQKRDFIVTWSMVARVPIFAQLEIDDLQEIMDRLHSKYCAQDEIIVHRGEPAEAMYFIATGKVEIELSPKPVTMGPGEFFGEMAILNRSERSATVRALKPSKLLVLDARSQSPHGSQPAHGGPDPESRRSTLKGIAAGLIRWSLNRPPIAIGKPS